MLTCADCGFDWMGDLDYHPHFPSAKEAELQAVECYDFIRAADDSLRCKPCAMEANCAAAGRHEFTEWTAGPGRQRYRWCTVCDETEMRLADLPTACDCGHQHAGPELGGICIGCACGVTS
jgi:hypothetical protein